MNRFPGRQRGVVMITALLLIVVLTLIAVTGMDDTVMEERMAGNFGQTITAQQAAEMALREIEGWIESDVHSNMFLKCNDMANSGVDWNEFYIGSASDPGVFSTGSGNVEGLYAHVKEPTCFGYEPVYPASSDEAFKWFDPREDSAWILLGVLEKSYLEIGEDITIKDINGNPQTTALPLIAGVRQPRFIVEYLGAYPVGARDVSVRNYQVLSDPAKRFMFRITTKAWGTNENSVYVLQSNYQTPL